MKISMIGINIIFRIKELIRLITIRAFEFFN